jgi:hypothetical protein
MKKIKLILVALGAASALAFAGCTSATTGGNSTVGSTISTALQNPAVQQIADSALTDALTIGLNALGASVKEAAPYIPAIVAKLPSAVQGATTALAAATAIQSTVAASGAPPAVQAQILSAATASLAPPATATTGTAPQADAQTDAVNAYKAAVAAALANSG